MSAPQVTSADSASRIAALTATQARLTLDCLDVLFPEVMKRALTLIETRFPAPAGDEALPFIHEHDQFSELASELADRFEGINAATVAKAVLTWGWRRPS